MRLSLFLVGICVTAGLASAPVCAQGARVGRVRIDLFATPQRVPADGHSAARIRIEVRDTRNSFVPDSTELIVHSDLGLLSVSGADRRDTVSLHTQGGFAIIELVSDIAGTATVGAQVLDSRNQCLVDFVPPGQAVEPEGRVVDVKGGWVGYAPDLGLIQARDRAQITFGRLTIEVGDVAEVDTNAYIIKAQSVIVKRDGKEIAGEDLYLDLTSRKLVVRRLAASGVERQTYNLGTLTPAAEDLEVPADAFRMSQKESDTWLVASGASFFMGEKVCLRHAGLYIQGQKVFRFPPLWVVAMPGYSGSSNSQVLGMSSSGGLAVNMPFFYRVTDSAAGAIKVQKGTSAGSVMAREGWTLGLQEEYRTARNCEGTFAVEGLPRSDWGFNWRDTRPLFGESQAAFNLGMPDHRSLFADASLYRFNPTHRFNLRASTSRPDGYDTSYAVDADWLTNSRQISSRVAYRVGTTVGIHREGVADPDTSQFRQRTVFRNQLFGALDFVPWRLSGRTLLTPSLTNVYQWDTGNLHTNSLRGQLALDQAFGNTTGASLSFAAEQPSGFADRRGLQQLVSLDFHSDRGKWNTFWNASRDITNDTQYALMTLDYFPKQLWRLGFTKSYYSFSDTSFNDLETTLARKIGDRELGLTYSTATHKVWLEFGGFGLF
jgi:hypothetical protein